MKKDLERNLWGKHDFIVLAAFRYCLGRRTYIVSDCAEWLLHHWESINKNVKELIVREIKDALERGYAGDGCDCSQWERVLCFDYVKEYKRNIMTKEKWIQDAVKKPGSLKKSLHVKKGEKIPEKKLKKAEHSKNPKLRKRAVLAETLKKMHS